MPLKALLFDCDGVIAETEGDGHRVAFNEAFAREGIDARWDVQQYGELLKVGGGKERMRFFFGSDPGKYPPAEFGDERIANLHRIKTEIFL
ncbi:MAG: HAD family hydrolase, partial [Clostridiales Family XIII bacterium]|nr:HAD family hydrolase [Clostridiales Family XIII bacterium]